MSSAAAELADDVFIVARDHRGATLRIEAVVAAAAVGKWYERVILEQTDGAVEATCTCADADCVHTQAVLIASGLALPPLGPGHRRAVAPPQVEIGTSTTSGDWFDLDITVSIEGEEVDFEALFAALVRDDSMFVLPSGTWFPLDSPELDQLRRIIEEARDLNDPRGPLRVNRYQIDLWEELGELDLVSAQQHRWWEAVHQLTQEDRMDELPPPSGLQAQMRHYQRFGYSWLSFLYDHGLGGVLADDMGLGKTLQTLAMIQRVHEHSPDAAPFLIIAPTSVMSNWSREAAEFTPELQVTVISSTEPRRGSELAEAVSGADVVVVSYALFRLEFASYDALQWSGLVLDEAQMIKNHTSRGYRAARNLRTPFKLVVTGTPMENNLQELWALTSIACPGLLGGRKEFGRVFREPIEKDLDTAQLTRLRSRLRPFLLRRTKDRVAAELPAKQEQVLELELDSEHRRLYDRRLQRERQKVLGLVDNLTVNRFEIFRSLTRLRQLALDAELIGEGKAPSAKLGALETLLQEAVGDGHQVLVLSQFTRFLDKARQATASAGISSAYLDGSTSDRTAAIEQFRSGEVPVFFVSMKAGGFGLNLVEADYVILLDPWWNPAAEEQAIDRAHRIGQTRSVMVYRLVSKDTIEAKVMALKKSKADLFNRVLNGSNPADSGELTAEDIRAIIS
ncbi:DEAD/DEAH box helicase [Nesterenkonia natronophila]|uniref:DEAD/DEAH box helicase n=1 Tax=Nesterenkonia natronophila TaxID=2174932 RepID=A0A3A4G418_9MICC|nr:DEAD/DEAH box helicase [Nesterenkonia natronophila]RJN33119.1 DEAD/DEAH box helicase [Nesterenkonia natronophila]